MASAERILVPYDGSELAQQALEYTIDRHPDAAITLLYVVDSRLEHPPARNIEDTNLETLFSQRENEAKDLLTEAVTAVESYDGEIDTDIDYGLVSKVIESYVEDNDIDHIVIGSHGRTGIDRLLLGSIAEKTVRRAPVPVTVIR